MELGNGTQHFVCTLSARFTLENVVHYPVCHPARCAAVQFVRVRDFLVIPTLAVAGLAQARLNNTLEYGISTGKDLSLRTWIYC